MARRMRTALIAEDENGQPRVLSAATWSEWEGRSVRLAGEIMVDDEQRGKGIGSRIIAAVHEKEVQHSRALSSGGNGATCGQNFPHHMLGFEDLEYRQMILDTPPLG